MKKRKFHEFICSTLYTHYSELLEILLKIKTAGQNPPLDSVRQNITQLSQLHILQTLQSSKGVIMYEGYFDLC